MSDLSCASATTPSYDIGPYEISGIASDLAGNIIVATGRDLRKITMPGGTVVTVPLEDRGFLTGVAVDGSENIYVRSEQGIVRKINSAGVPLATYNTFDSTSIGLAVDSKGNIFMLDDYGVRWVPAGQNSARPLAGRQAGAGYGSSDGIGTMAGFRSPRGITVDRQDNLYVADTGNSTIRKLTSLPAGSSSIPEVVTTIAGSAGGTGSLDGLGPVARFNRPKGIASDAMGNLFVADTQNHTIRKISTSADPSLYFSQLGGGQGITSDFELLNPSSSTAVSGRVEFFDDLGLPLIATIAGVGMTTGVDFLISPLGRFRASTQASGVYAVGAARVNATSLIDGVIRFSLPGLGIAGVASSKPVTSLITPARVSMTAVNTGIAIHNVGDVPIDIEISLRDSEGRLVQGASRTIRAFPARGHMARFIHELFPGLSLNGFDGSLVVRAIGGRIAATALELGSRPGDFTTLPIVEIR